MYRVKLSARFIIAAIYLTLLLSNHSTVFANDFLSSAEMRELQDSIAPVVIFGNPTVSAGTAQAALKASHKYNATDAEIAVGFGPTGTFSATTLTLEAPSGYTFATDCAASREVDATDGVTFNEGGTNLDSRNAKGLAVTCAADTNDSKKATITFGSAPSAVSNTQLHAFAVKLATTPSSTVAGWKVSYGGQTNQSPDAAWNMVTVKAVKGWSGLPAVTDKLGTPDNTEASLRPTSLDGEKSVDVEVYHAITTPLTANSAWRIKLPSHLSLTAGSCTTTAIGLTFKVCASGGSCTAKTVDNISGTTIANSKEVGCTASAASLLLLTKDAIAANSGLYAKFKVVTARLTSDTTLTGGYVTTCPGKTACAEKTLSAYKTDNDHEDWGPIKADVTVKKSGAAVPVMWACLMALFALNK